MRLLKIYFVPFFILLALSVSPLNLHAQEKKAKVKEPKGYHSPHKATLWSLIPGGGQIYNKKYWKLPIVYAGFVVTGYFAVANRQEYLKFSDAYICKVNATADDPCTDPLAAKYTSSQLVTIRDGYRRNMELSYILMGAWYLLQMLDATVDAHLYHWDVTDDISLEWEPVVQPFQANHYMPPHQGIRIAINF